MGRPSTPDMGTFVYWIKEFDVVGCHWPLLRRKQPWRKKNCGHRRGWPWSPPWKKYDCRPLRMFLPHSCFLFLVGFRVSSILYDSIIVYLCVCVILCCSVAKRQCRIQNTMFMRIRIPRAGATYKMTFHPCKCVHLMTFTSFVTFLLLWNRISEVEQLEETNQAAARQVGRSCTWKIDPQVMKDGNVCDIH